jgi:hypothetical protein
MEYAGFVMPFVVLALLVGYFVIMVLTPAEGDEQQPLHAKVWSQNVTDELKVPAGVSYETTVTYSDQAGAGRTVPLSALRPIVSSDFSKFIAGNYTEANHSAGDHLIIVLKVVGVQETSAGAYVFPAGSQRGGCDGSLRSKWVSSTNTNCVLV